MTEDSAAAAGLRQRAQGSWSILKELAGRSEPDLRRILRPHKESAAHDGAEAFEGRRLRADLDDALDRLTLLELGNETGLLDVSVLLIPGLPKLFESSAFAKYLSSYLHFDVRFVADRLVSAGVLRADAGVVDPEINDLPVAWAAPPEIESNQDDQAAQIQAYVQSRANLDREEDVKEALRFLDGFHEPGEPAQYQLWLRGLGSHPLQTGRFERLTRGLLAFAEEKARFYRHLEDSVAELGARREDSLKTWRDRDQVKGAWSARHPLTARFGCVDFYWLAQLLRADVREDGAVSYANGSWLHLISARARVHAGTSANRNLDASGDLRAGEGRAGEGRPARDGHQVEAIQCIDEVLHGVFDYACDLVQNSFAISCERYEQQVNRGNRPSPPEKTVPWRVAYDEELEEIARQRKERRFDDATRFDAHLISDAAAQGHRWRRRIRTGEHLDDIVGLAFSGGGIRSATFNLGVLQRLQELDLLRHVDYLSTVSGGGYIGAWLLANVRRTKYWLSRQTNWEPSIVHLRRFSNYLAPRTGLMSADTWTMWGSWMRNAFLIQLSAAAWLTVVFLATRVLKGAFYAEGREPLAGLPPGLTIAVLWAFVALSVAFNIRKNASRNRERTVLGTAVIPSWVSAFVTAVLMWAHCSGATSYGGVLADEWSSLQPLFAVLFVGFYLLSWLSIDSLKHCWFLAVLPAGVCAAAIFLGWGGVIYAFEYFSRHPHGSWYAYVFGAPLVLAVMTLVVALMIGLVGPASGDWRREWWTRFGAWLGIYGIAFLGIGTVGVFGPYFTLWLLQHEGHVKWSAVLAWIGSAVGGLLSGNSSRTNGEARGSRKQRALVAVANVAAFAFILGASLVTATVLHLLVAYSADQEVNPFDQGTRDTYWLVMDAHSPAVYAVAIAALSAVAVVFSSRFDINIFGLNQFYQNRLVRCYLGATRWREGLRRPHLFTGFDHRDDILLSELRHARKMGGIAYRGPFPIVNCSLNLGGSSDLSLHTRHSASFVLTPLRAGADREQVGFASACGEPRSFGGGVTLGQAISVSGAAASPNMGHNSSPLVAVLLTLFNVRLAWWFPNPGKRRWYKSSLRLSMWYLLKELFASADERNFFVNISDGGHFENLGIYELVRRRCKVIIACDAECDSDLSFGSLGNVVRMCATDFNAKVDIDVESIRREKGGAFSRAHCAVGTITYANGSCGYLIYIKASMTGDEDVSVEQYYASHGQFPHESTGDQFFSEDQFESYRRLGHHITSVTFHGVEHHESLVAMAGRLKDLWVPASVAHDSFIAQANALETMWERFRGCPELKELLKELTGDEPTSTRELSAEELCVCLELLQLMENAFVALRLDEFWTHPDNRGWAMLFSRWARSATLRASWATHRHTFGIRFEHFCHQRLGLESDREAVRL